MISCCVKSLNHEDAFVLITADEVYYYIPKFANVIEKSKAKDFSTLVCQTGDLGTSAKNPLDAKKNKKFWKIIGEKLASPDKKKIDPDASDIKFENSYFENDRIWQIHAENDSYKLKPETDKWGSIPSQSLLTSEKIFIFEFGSEVYIWMGSQAGFAPRRFAVKLAKELWKKYPRGENDLLAKITQNRETALFTEKFSDWLRPNQENILLQITHLRTSSNVSDKPDKIVFCDSKSEILEMSLMSDRNNVAGGAGEICDSDGRILSITSIKYNLYHVQNKELVEIDPAENEILSDTSVIVLKWTFTVSGTGRWKGKESKSKKNKEKTKGAERQIVFTWAGESANELEVGEMALLVSEQNIGKVSIIN